MKRTFIAFIFLFIIANIHSQENFSMDEGTVTQYEMDMTEYSKDSDAEALVIYEKGEYRFTYDDNFGFMLRMTITTKIKILSQAGEKYATFEIPYYFENNRSFERIENIEGLTYNYDGTSLNKTILENKNIFDEKETEHWHSKKLTMPDVRPGSVVELKYTILTPFFTNMRTWEFQKNIPVKYSKLRYKAIPYYEYTFSANGITKLDEQTSEVLNREIRHRRLLYKEMQYDFGLKDIPAFRDEEFISSEVDYLIALRFQLSRIHRPTGGKTDYISTWPKLTENLARHDNFGKHINNCKKAAKKILPTLEIEGKTEIEQLKIIIEYVKRNYNWNRRNSIYNSQKVSDFIKTKRGNVADINLYLIGFLEEAKLSVNPVILSTRSNGKIDTSYPFLHFFNYVIAEVEIDDKKYHIDATEPMLAYNIIPERCINTNGLVVKAKKEEWTYMTQRATDYLQKELKITLNPENNELLVDATYSAVGNSAYRYRTSYMGKYENLIKHIKDTEDVNVIDNKIEIEDTALESPFKLKYSFGTLSEKSSDKIFLNPFCKLQSSENPFKQTARTLPVDLISTITRRYRSTIEIPQGYKIEHLPESNVQSNDAMSIAYNAKLLDEKTLLIDASYSFNKTTYPANEYDFLKNTYSKMLSKFTEMIVLVKEAEEEK